MTVTRRDGKPLSIMCVAMIFSNNHVAKTGVRIKCELLLIVNYQTNSWYHYQLLSYIYKLMYHETRATSCPASKSPRRVIREGRMELHARQPNHAPTAAVQRGPRRPPHRPWLWWRYHYLPWVTGCRPRSRTRRPPAGPGSGRSRRQGWIQRRRCRARARCAVAAAAG